jgi:hypothetical protein
MITDVKEAYPGNITRAEIRQVNTKKGIGYCFNVYWDNREYPNFTSSAVKTKKGAQRNLNIYLETRKFSLYGNAE